MVAIDPDPPRGVDMAVAFDDDVAVSHSLDAKATHHKLRYLVHARQQIIGIHLRIYP